MKTPCIYCQKPLDLRFRAHPICGECYWDKIFERIPVWKGYLWAAIVIAFVGFMISYWQGEQRRQQAEALKTAVEQLKDNHEPITAENIQEQMDANAEWESDNSRGGDY